MMQKQLQESFGALLRHLSVEVGKSSLRDPQKAFLVMFMHREETENLSFE